MISIDRMTETDIKEVALLEQAAFSVPWSAEGFRDGLKRTDSVFVTAKEDGRIIGYCGCLQVLDEAEITNISVASEARNRGIGAQILESVFGICKENGARMMFLEVRAGNAAAIHLYEKSGFTAIGVRKNFYEKPQEDAVIMQKYL